MQTALHVQVDLVDSMGSIVGTGNGVGLSTEQRKRLTIAVELVANPSAIFMVWAIALMLGRRDACYVMPFSFCP